MNREKYFTENVVGFDVKIRLLKNDATSFLYGF